MDWQSGIGLKSGFPTVSWKEEEAQRQPQAGELKLLEWHHQPATCHHQLSSDTINFWSDTTNHVTRHHHFFVWHHELLE